MKKRLFAGLIALVMIGGLLPVFAMADVGGFYVRDVGSDKDGDGTESNPYATLAKAVDVAGDGAVIYVMSDLTMTECARFYNKNLTITSYGNNTYTITRGGGFSRQQDDARSTYNPAMIEVQGENSCGLTLKNIILDDAGIKEGTVFAQAISGEGKDNNTVYVQDAVIASNATKDGTIILDEGAIIRNFGGMSAVRVTDRAKLVMKNGSKIEDTKVTDRVKGEPGSVGPAGAVWIQGAEFTMESGAEISNVTGRAVYADGGKVTINGTIQNIVPDKDMWQETNGVAIHLRGNANGILENDAKVTNIEGKGESDTVIATYGSDFEMESDSTLLLLKNITALYADDSGNNYSHNMVINGTITDCSGSKSLMRSWYAQITLGPRGLVTNCSSVSAGGLLYTNNGSRYLIQGTITGNNASAGMIYLANQSGGRVSAIMEEGASITNNTGLGVRVNNGSLFTMEGGEISSNTGIGIRVSGKPAHKGVHFIMNGGKITDNGSYGIAYTVDGESIVELNGGTVSGNANGGVQVYASDGAACDAYEYVKLQSGVIESSRKIELPFFGTLTLDENYGTVLLGRAADSTIKKTIESLAFAQDNSKVWSANGSALYIKATESGNYHFLTTRSVSADKNTELYFGYIPLDQNGKPIEGGTLTLVKFPYNVAKNLDVTLKNLVANQAYAVMFLNSNDPVTQYTVDFDLDGGSFKDSSMVNSVIINNGNYLPETYWNTGSVIKDGFIFDGWYKEEDDGSLGQLWTPDMPVIKSMTLKAKWYNSIITFDTNGGSFSDGSTIREMRVESGSTVSLPNSPTRNGYTFMGWNTKADGSGEAFTSSTIVNSDLVVYAQWKSINGNEGHESTTYYTLHYESNGGTSYSDELYAYGTTVKLDKVPTREGYDFTGWYSDKALTNEIASVRITKNTTVYAGWRKAETNPNTGAYVLSATVIGALAGARF